MSSMHLRFISPLLLVSSVKLFATKHTYCDQCSNKYKWNSNWDMREGKKSSSVRQIVLIRHGQYLQKQKTDEASILTEKGSQQAYLTGIRLKELIDANIIYPVRKIRYSTMTRATQTYLQIMPSLNYLEEHKIQPCSLIREGAVCKPEPSSSSWVVAEEEFVKDGLRVDAAFAHYFQRSLDDKEIEEDGVDGDHSDILICHGNVIRYFVMRALQLPREAWLRTAVYNASITVINIYPSGRVSLYCMGDVGHLPANMITYN